MTDGRNPVRATLSSSTWLKTYGLSAQRLTLKDLLQSIGFKKRSERVTVLRKEISARYSDDLFPLFQDRDGTLYNICCGESRLLSVRQKLINQIRLYRERLDWLSSGSRYVLGIVEEMSVGIVIDSTSSGSGEAYLKSLRNDLVHWVEEQLSALGKVNIIWCGRSGFVEWRESVSTPNLDSLSDWLMERTKSEDESSSLPDRTVITDAVLRASRDEGAQAIYLITNGEFLKSEANVFVRKMKGKKMLLHVIAYSCTNKSRLSRLRSLATKGERRFHAHPSVRPGMGALETSAHSTSSGLADENAEIVCENVQLMFDELQKASDVLAEMTALYEDVRRDKQVEPEIEFGSTGGEFRGEESSMSSRDWLDKHSLKAKNLLFRDLVSTVSFRHCKSVVDIRRAPVDANPDSPSVSNQTVIDAKYCGRFAHVRWHDGSVRHVFLSQFAYEQHRLKVLAALDKYKTRLAWLKKGSRELFGTIVEDNVSVLLDTSSSMENHLDIVKEKFDFLVKEQLRFRSKFNVIHFGTKAEGWRPQLTDVTPQNISLALDWVNSLSASGSTNVYDALFLALRDPSTQALYLLTDGRPDQPPDFILKHFQHRCIVPIHPISFNCDDPEANQFLYKLAGLTGGRYHFYSDEQRPFELFSVTPRPYESEDVHLVREELEAAETELERLDELREECLAVEKKFSKRALHTSRSSPPRDELVRDDSNSKAGKKLRPLSLSSKKWLKKHGLVAKGLTLLSVLQPTFIEHKPTQVDILNKSVESRVFDSLLPVRHVSEDGKEIRLVNPQAVNLSRYEERLKDAMATYEKRLNALVWKALSQDSKEDSALSKDAVSFRSNRDLLTMQLARQSDWPAKKADISLLDEEIDKALLYLKQSEALRLAQKPDESSSLTDFKSTSTKSDSSVPKAHPNKTGRFSKGHKVLARDEISGYYFRGIIVDCVDPRHVDIDFEEGFSQIVNSQHVMETGGAQPCSPLKVGECVLCEVSRPIDFSGDGNHEQAHFWLPGLVGAQPAQLQRGPQFYTVIDCTNKRVVCQRRKIRRISRKQYSFAVRYISSAGARNARSAKIDLFPSEILKATPMSRPDSPTSMKSVASVAEKSEEEKEAPSERKDVEIMSKIEKHGSDIERLAETLNRISLGQKRLEELIDLGERERAKSDVEVRRLVEEHGRVFVEMKTTQENRFRELGESVRQRDEMLERERERVRKGHDESQTARLLEKEAPSRTIVLAEKEIQTGEQEPEPVQERGSENETVLVSSGNEGFLISQAPLAPPVEQHVSTPMYCEVLAQWPFDGWYYRGVVVFDYGDGTFIVDDGTGDMERLPYQYLITDEEDRNIIIRVNDYVVGLHPCYSLSYAPGRVCQVSPDCWTLLVEFYDGQQANLTREEVYWLSPQRYSEDYDFIRERETSWIGQTVIAKRDEDGYYYPGLVKEKVSGCRQYVIKWVDSDKRNQVQDMRHLFGVSQKVRALETGDRILASPDGGYHYMPGWVCSVFRNEISVNFCTGKRVDCVNALSCFWISQDYFDESVQFIREREKKL